MKTIRFGFAVLLSCVLLCLPEKGIGEESIDLYVKEVLFTCAWGDTVETLGYRPPFYREDGFPDAGRGPRAFDVDEKGNIYITDTVKKRVVKFNEHGKFLLAFGEDVLRQPKNIAVAGNGDIYVADLVSQSPVYKWDSLGRFKGLVLDKRKDGKHVWGIRSGPRGSIIINYTPDEQGLSKYLKLDREGLYVEEVANYWINDKGISFRIQALNLLLFQDGKMIESVARKSISPDISKFGPVGFDDKNSIYLINPDRPENRQRKIVKVRGKNIVATLHTEPTLPRVGIRTEILVQPNGDIYQMRNLEEGLQIIRFKLQRETEAVQSK